MLRQVSNWQNRCRSEIESKSWYLSFEIRTANNSHSLDIATHICGPTRYEQPG